MKYNSETLVTYCNVNNITIINHYNHKDITRESYIQLKCIECSDQFDKNFRQLVKTGAYCQKCMSNIANNKIRSAKVKYDTNMLTDFCNINKIMLTNDYSNKFVNRDTIIEGNCLNENCENNFRKHFRQLLKIGGYCEDCSKINGKHKIKETNLKKIGVDNPMKNAEIREKQKQTIIEKYGVEHNSQSEEIKIKKENTCINNYGFVSHLKSPIIREQIKETNLEKYGVENPQQNTEIRNKTNNTNLVRYGCKTPIGSKYIKEKIIQTNLEKYGVPHHSQNSQIAENMLNAAYNKKQYILPSGKLLHYQGYENFALDELLHIEKIDENEIITNRKDVPEIWYIDKNNKKRRHYVDIYIKSQNRCIEVKSTWTNQSKNNVFEKQCSGQDLGYKYEIWIYDKKGNKVIN
jgi:hypothetical protein